MRRTAKLFGYAVGRKLRLIPTTPAGKYQWYC